MRPMRDVSRLFTLGVVGLWAALVALPVWISLATGQPGEGLPLLGVPLWFAVMRVGRWLSPAARADALLRRGRHEQALALCDTALAMQGSGAWLGPRRLVWLNRRTAALLALGRTPEALANALEALGLSADPETLGNVGLALLRLNRFGEAAHAAKLAQAATRQRSMLANAVLASVMLGRGRPAEAESLALAGVEDARALVPLVRDEHYAWCLALLCWAERRLASGTPAGKVQAAGQLVAVEARRDHMHELRRLVRRRGYLRTLALVEEAEGLAATGSDADRPEALAKLEAASRLWPAYVSWYATQPGTLESLRAEPSAVALAQLAVADMERAQSSSPEPDMVAQALAAAQEVARPRPAPQADASALMTQVVTLAATLALLLLWTWRFFFTGM